MAIYLKEPLNQTLKNDVLSFLHSQNLPQLYRGYEWQNDLWKTGFRDILKLEVSGRDSFRRASLPKEFVLAVTEWGRLRNPGRVKYSSEIHFAEDSNPADLLLRIQNNVKGIGPTYQSKLIRFLMPAAAGAIDTRIVRVFGVGDSRSNKHQWLEVQVRNYGCGWYIPENQSAWPSGFYKWIGILEYAANVLNKNKEARPHPKEFCVAGLRTEGIWTCADTQMAVFTYATKSIAKQL
jgi:hypothetical protein